MAVSRPCYCTREDVQRALDVKETARSTARLDRAIEAASDTIDGGVSRIGGLLKRRFYPETRTMTFDWPNHQYAVSWRLWLNQHELVSATTVTSGGTTIAASDYFLRPDDGPPYTHIEIDLDSSAAWSSGDTHQRSISIAGVYGYSDDTATAGALAEALDASETGVDVTDSAAIGVGDIIIVDSERMLITGKTMLDTAQNTGGALTAAKNDVTVAVTDGTAYHLDETILVDSERMLIVDIAGNTLTVQRAWDGTVLAAHSSGADIYAPRTLTVVRGALGSTAATHTTSTAVYRHVVPPGVRKLAIALAINQLEQETAGYARQAGSGDNAREVSGRGVRAVIDEIVTAYGRKARIRAI